MLNLLKFKKYKNLSKTYCSKQLTSPYSHCGYCGLKDTIETFPHVCSSCNNTTFRNPIPVAVGLLPFALDNDIYGILLTKRAIKPFIGEFCLPGGFVNWGESWQEAISREVFEETTLITDPKEFLLKDVHSTPDNTRILIFGYSRKVRNISELRNFKPNNESSAIMIGSSDTKLCFSLHQEVYQDWFRRVLRE